MCVYEGYDCVCVGYDVYVTMWGVIICMCVQVIMCVCGGGYDVCVGLRCVCVRCVYGRVIMYMNYDCVWGVMTCML